MFQKKVIVITGGAGGIGKCITEVFQKQGAYVCVIDCVEGGHYVGDIANKETLEDFAQTVIEKYGKVPKSIPFLQESNDDRNIDNFILRGHVIPSSFHVAVNIFIQS